MMRWTVISFQAEYHRHDAAPRHTLCRIGCGNHGARARRARRGINDQRARRMYPGLLILNGPDVQSSGPLL